MTHSIEQDHVTRLANVDAEKPANTIQSCVAHFLIASSDQERSQHAAQAAFGEAGGATHEPASQRWQARLRAGRVVGAEPGALREARQGAFLRPARGSVGRVQRHMEGRADPASRDSGMAGAKRHPAALFAAHPRRNDSSIRSSRPEMTPKPCPSRGCAATGNGLEGFRAALQGAGFCFSLCTALCAALYRNMTKE